EASAAMVVESKTTSPPCTRPPAFVIAVSKDGSMVSRTTTFVPTPSPLLATTIVYLTVSPGLNGGAFKSATVFVTTNVGEARTTTSAGGVAKSGRATTVSGADDTSSANDGSTCGDKCAVLTMTKPSGVFASTVARMTKSPVVGPATANAPVTRPVPEAPPAPQLANAPGGV